MCHIWQLQPKNELSLEEWRLLLADPIFRSIRQLTIAGGEPTLHPQLDQLIDLFLKKMPHLYSLNITSNGFLGDSLVKLVRHWGPICYRRGVKFVIAISLDGFAASHDYLRGVPGAFQRTYGTILRLRRLRSRYHFHLRVSGVICRQNLGEIENLAATLKKRSIPFTYQLIGFHDTYVNNLSARSKLDFRPQDYPRLLALLKRLARLPGWHNWQRLLRSYYWHDMLSLYQGGRRRVPCPFLYDAFVIDSLGDVYYCLSAPKIGNWRQTKSISAIYYRPANQRRRWQMWTSRCRYCNSGCFVTTAIAKDGWRFFLFYLRRSIFAVWIIMRQSVFKLIAR